MSESAVNQFGNILLSGKTGKNQGHFKVHANGFIWKKANGGKLVEIASTDIADIMFSKVVGGIQVAVRDKVGAVSKFVGFREQDLKILRSHCKDHFQKEMIERPVTVTGHNWGEVSINGGMLSFNVGRGASTDPNAPYGFEVNLTDINQATAQKNKVLVEFHVDDEPGGEQVDELVDISFYVPPTSEVFTADEEKTPAEVLRDQVLMHADVGATSDDVITTFNQVSCVVPRLKVDVEFTPSFLKLHGQTQEFKIRYSSLIRLFMLPKPNLPQTIVVLSLDPPIRSGNTMYPHLLLQFGNEEDETEIELDLDQETLTSKYNDKLEASYSGPTFEVFCKVLKGLSGAKLSKPGVFVSAQQMKAVRCSMKADDGYLFPLERAFFYITKPPTLITYDDIAEIEFLRQDQGISSAKTFDLRVATKGSGPEHVFRGIQRMEYSNLFAFMQAKKLRIINVGKGGIDQGYDDGLDLGDDDDDPHMARVRSERGGEGESESEDEDFIMADGSSDGGEPTDSSSGSESDGSKSGGDSDSDGEDGSPGKKPEKEKKEKKEKKRPAEKVAKASPAKKPKKPPAEKPEKGGKKQKKKKDPNAPKRPMSAFMIFSNKNREAIKNANPEMGIGDIAKQLGERWRNMTAEDKVEYDEEAKENKVKYDEQMKAYNAGKSSGAGGSSGAADGGSPIGAVGAEIFDSDDD